MNVANNYFYEQEYLSAKNLFYPIIYWIHRIRINLCIPPNLCDLHAPLHFMTIQLINSCMSVISMWSL